MNGAQGGGEQVGQRAGRLDGVHDQVGGHQDNAHEGDVQLGYQGGGEGNARGGVHHQHSEGQDEGQRDGLQHVRVIGRQIGDGEGVTQKMDVRKQTPSARLNPGLRRKATPKRKIKEIEPGLVQEKITSFLRLFPNLGDKGTTFKNKNGDSKSTPSLKRKVNLDLEEGISSAKRRCKD